MSAFAFSVFTLVDAKSINEDELVNIFALKSTPHFIYHALSSKAIHRLLL